MRPTHTILNFALTAVLWIAVLWAIRQRRARMAANPSPRELRGNLLHNVGTVTAMVGVTSFFAWLMTDVGPDWLHALSAPAALIFIAVGAALIGYGSWLGGEP